MCVVCKDVGMVIRKSSVVLFMILGQNSQALHPLNETLIVYIVSFEVVHQEELRLIYQTM